MAAASELTLVFIDVLGLKGINAQNGREAGDDALRYVVGQTKTELRVSDILFRYGSAQFVAILHHTKLSAAKMIAERIQENILEPADVSKAGSHPAIKVIATCVSAPRDGSSFRELLLAAQRQIASRQDQSSIQVH